MADLRVKDGLIVLINTKEEVVYSLPDSDGLPGQAMVTDGNGKLSFATDATIDIKLSDGTVVAKLNGRAL